MEASRLKLNTPRLAVHGSRFNNSRNKYDSDNNNDNDDDDSININSSSSSAAILRLVSLAAIRPRPVGAQGMAPPRSWALAHYHAEELSKGSAVYLLCRTCFPIGRHRPSSKEFESMADPGK